MALLYEPKYVMNFSEKKWYKGPTDIWLVRIKKKLDFILWAPH